jgi:hypothetical protein
LDESAQGNPDRHIGDVGDVLASVAWEGGRIDDATDEKERDGLERQIEDVTHERGAIGHEN